MACGEKGRKAPRSACSFINRMSALTLTAVYPALSKTAWGDVKSLPSYFFILFIFITINSSKWPSFDKAWPGGRLTVLWGEGAWPEEVIQLPCFVNMLALVQQSTVWYEDIFWSQQYTLAHELAASGCTRNSSLAPFKWEVWVRST